MTSTQKPDAAKIANALLAIFDVIVDLVKAGGPMGTPSGTLYAALMTHGCTLEQYEMIMDVLVKAGRLTKKGLLYFAPEAK